MLPNYVKAFTGAFFLIGHAVDTIKSRNEHQYENGYYYTDYDSDNSQPDVDPYWDNQKKYMVDPESYYGQMPKELQLAVVVEQNKQEFKAAGLGNSSNYIFYGPPGTGKTFVASIFAQKIGAEFMYVQGSELQGKYVGDSLEKPEMLFEKARARRDKTDRPVVMFIDEIDTVIGSREHTMHQSHQELIGSMLKQIGSDINERIIVVGATNYLYHLDEALLRSGRFENHIEFTLPTLQERKQFCLFLIKSYEHIFDTSINWNQVAQLLHNKNYADIKKVIDDLKQLYVLQRINNQVAKITDADILAYFGKDPKK